MSRTTSHTRDRRKTGRSRQYHAGSNRRAERPGLAARPAHELLQLLRLGFPYKMLATVSEETGIPSRELADIIQIPERTLARRRIAGRLGQDESERLLRVARVVDKAVQLFEGDVKAAAAWLKTPQKALSYNTPLSYARFELGAQEVQDLIGRLEHGVFS